MYVAYIPAGRKLRLLRRIEDPAARDRAQRQLRLLELRLRETRGHGLDPALLAELQAQLERLGGGSDSGLR